MKKGKMLANILSFLVGLAFGMACAYFFMEYGKTQDIFLMYRGIVMLVGFIAYLAKTTIQAKQQV